MKNPSQISTSTTRSTQPNSWKNKSQIHARITKYTTTYFMKESQNPHNLRQTRITNTHNLIHAGTTVISTTHVIQELQKYPQLISCRNYKNLISRKIYKYINIHNSCHARITKVSTTLIMRELKKYPQCISCMIYKNINIHNPQLMSCKNYM